MTDRPQYKTALEWTLRPVTKVLNDRTPIYGWKTLCILSPEPYVPGDYVACVLEIPLRGSLPSRTVCVECAVTVERVEVNANEPGFVLSCRVHDCDVTERV